MIEKICTVESLQTLAPNIFLLTFRSEEIAQTVLPGQFVNIRVSNSLHPLLRRPFSVYRAEGDSVQIIFNVMGIGTGILSTKRSGDTIDVLGPLGKPFRLDASYETALLVAGGLGVAPLPILTVSLRKRGKSIRTYFGARTKDQIVRAHLTNLQVATDDGTEGFCGTVVELFREELEHQQFSSPKIFACGPNAMLRSLAVVAENFKIPCEVSLESVMACGIGICQGCPVQLSTETRSYALICRDGPVFNIHDIKMP